MDKIVVNNRVQVPMADLHFRFSRSGGPGGQNVNRVSTRVELVFDLPASSLDAATKEILKSKLQTKLDSTDSLHIVSQESRSQWKNKQDTIEKFIHLLKTALRPTKQRIPTRATKGSKETRVQGKKERGKLKKMRKVDVHKELS